MLPTPLPTFSEFIAILQDDIDAKDEYLNEFPCAMTQEIINLGYFSETIIKCCFFENYIACVDVYYDYIRNHCC